MSTAMQNMNGGFASDFAAFYAEAYGRFEQSHRLVGSLGIDMMRIEQDSHETLDVIGDSLGVALVEAAEISHASIDAGDGVRRWTRSGRACVGTSAIHVPNSEALIQVEGPHTMLVASVPTAPLSAMLEEVDGPLLSAFDAIAYRELADPFLARTMQTIWRTSQREGPTSALAVDGHVNLLVSHLIESADAEKAKRARAVPTLADRAVARAIEIMDADFAQEITAERLAREVGVSQFHFARAFKAATGRAPHEALLERRIAHGERLLTTTEEPIAAIAFDCGFCSQAHFTTTMRRRTGHTPGELRRAARGKTG